MSFEFNGETYLDDRMYVLNLGVGSVSQAGKKETRYMLFTYRNTAALPPVRTDNFETKEEAIDYVKEVEFQVPLVSNHGTPLQIPEGVDPWEYWMDWLSERGLFSAITGYRHIPEQIRLQREMRQRQRQRQSMKSEIHN